MPKITAPAVSPQTVSVKAVAEEASRLSRAVAAANKNGNAWLTKTEAAALPPEFRDNYEKKRAASGNGMVSAKQLVEEFSAYASLAAQKADRNGDGLLSASEASRLPVALRDNVEALRGANQSSGLTGTEVARELRKISKDLTLTFFGEDDSGGATSVVHAKGPFEKVDSGNVESVFNAAFGKGKLTPENLWLTRSYKPEDHAELIELFKGYDPAMSGSADKLAKLFEGATIHALSVDTSRAFAGQQYLVAQMADGSLVGLKGGIAGMSL